MSDEPDLKRRLLRQAVAENLSTRRGEPPPWRPETPVRKRRTRWRLSLLALVPLSLIAAVQVLRQAPTVQADPPPGGVAELPVRPADPRADLRFDAPQPIDSDVFPLEVRRIMLDPGHGGDDLGTSEYDLAEKDLTLDISRRLAGLLRGAGYEVLLTRDGDRNLSLRERADLANGSRADLFVSIHVNWMSYRQIRGVETYFLGTTDDPELKELARRENRESGYSLADMKFLLESIYTGVRRDASRQFATRVQRSLHSSLRRVNPELKNRGVKTAPFVVLVSTEMPAILAEVSCLSNREEARLLSRPLYRDHIAEALFRGIRGYADDVHQTEEKGS